MTKIVNLRQARKAKKRVSKEKTAAANRTAFGRTKAEKSASAAEQTRDERALSGKRLETPAKPSSGTKSGDVPGDKGSQP